MSHLMVGSICLTDLDSLRKAVMKDERLEWVEGAENFHYWRGDNRPCAHKIKVVKGGHSGHEIGVVMEEDGKGYRLQWESDTGYGSFVGYSGEIIQTAYAKEASRAWAAKNGFTLSEATDSEGQIVLTLTN